MIIPGAIPVHPVEVYVALGLFLLLVLASIAVLVIRARRAITPEMRAAAAEPDPKTGISDDDWFRATR